MAQVQASYTRGSVVETLSEEQPPLSPPVFQEPTLDWGTGEILDSERNAAQRTALPSQAETQVRESLDALSAHGMEQKIEQFLNRIRSANMPETRAAIEQWIRQFLAYRVDQREARSLSLGIFIIRVIHTFLLTSTNPQDQAELLIWEDLCKNILQQMLPLGETVERFLQDVELMLREETLFRDRVARANQAVQVLLQAIQGATQNIDAQIDQAFNTIRSRLLAFQQSRREQYTRVNAECTALAQAVDQLRTQLAARATEIAAVGRQDAIAYQQLVANLDSCRATLERLG